MNKGHKMAETKTFEGRTAEEWRGMASGNYKRAAESFERCDTDGFLSQWASNTVAREYELKAELADQGGMDTFRALFDLEGNRVYAHEVETQFGYSWRLFDKETKETLGWFNESKAQKAETAVKNNAKKGFYVGAVKCEARVLSGGNNVNVHYFTAPRDKYMLDAEVVDNGH
jgi:hypothetical protein